MHDAHLEQCTKSRTKRFQFTSCRRNIQAERSGCVYRTIPRHILLSTTKLSVNKTTIGESATHNNLSNVFTSISYRIFCFNPKTKQKTFSFKRNSIKSPVVVLLVVLFFLIDSSNESSFHDSSE